MKINRLARFRPYPIDFILLSNEKCRNSPREVKMFEERQKTIETIRRLDIPQSELADIAEVIPQRISDYLRRRAVPSAQCAAIERAVAGVELVWSVTAPYKFSTSDPALFRQAITEVETAIAAATVESDLKKLSHLPA
jgi:hypothetical protein